MSNSNCLRGLRCPKCKQEDGLKIVARVMCFVTDDGSEPFGDHDWDDDSIAVCPECDFSGELREFDIRSGLMKQQVDITMKLSLWLDAALSDDDIVTHVRTALPAAFGEELTAMQNPVDIIEVQQEAEIYGTEEPPRRAYLVKVAGKVLETYRVVASSSEEAEDDWGLGELIDTDDEALESEVLTVEEL